MMKQFLRVKQIADQKFQREKSGSVLSEELNGVEKRVDLVKESCYATGKKLSACIHRLCPDSSSPDKRNGQKKIPEAALAQCMEEWGLSLGENSILGLTLADYAHIEDTLGHDLFNFTQEVRKNVVEPLQNILNTDISNILKYRKQLSKLTSEMDSSKARYESAWRSSMQATGNNAAKAQLLKEEAEDVVNRVEQCRDSLSAEMFNLVSREPEMSLLFVKLCRLQLDYHRKAFYMLESVLPEIETQIKSCPYQPVFGVSLEEHLRGAKREIAVVLETCICWLLESAMEEEGLFRIGGSTIKIKKMKSAFDASLHYLIADERDPHNIAGVLKLYLRSLPEPLLTYELYDQWVLAAVESDHDTRLKLMWNVVNSLPESHFKNLRYLIKFLSKFCGNSDVNKMSIQNIAIVIGPNLIWPPTENDTFGINMAATNLHTSIVDTLITYAEWFFPGECQFIVPMRENFKESSVLNGNDSALDSTNSNSPTSPSPRVRPRKKAAPKAPHTIRTQITRSSSCSGFQTTVSSASNFSESSRISCLSISHENLVNYSSKVNQDSHAPEISPASVTVRLKPPRQTRNGLPPVRISLPPVAERSRKPRDRPSVPPPERPDSFLKSTSISSVDFSIPERQSAEEEANFNRCEVSSFFPCPENRTMMLSSSPTFINSDDAMINCCKAGSPDDVFIESPVELDDISISFESSDSESYRECLMENSEVSELSPVHPAVQENYEVVQDGKKNFRATSDPLSTYDTTVSCTQEASNESNSYVTGGTPTWFDHYGDDKRQSNTLWFANSEDIEKVCTIEVGSSSSNKTHNAVKLRVNSETSNTRL